MNVEKTRDKVYLGIERQCADLPPNPYRVQKVLRAANQEESVVMKRKVSVAFAVTVAAVLLAAAALAAGIMMNVMTRHVAELDAKGLRTHWGLEEKYAFVSAMREAGYDMEEADWAILSDESKGDADREAAADRLVYARYGAVQEEANATHAEPLDTVLGAMPDIVEIFRERFMADHPDAREQDYLDALGYWLRDEYMPAYQAALDQEEAAAAAPIEPLTREGAESDARSYLTEVLGWSASDADKAVLTARQDAESGAWCVSVNGAGGEVTHWVTLADNGDFCRADTLETLLADVAFTNRQIALNTIGVDEVETVAKAAIADRYHVDENALNRYFIFTGDFYYDDPACVRVGVLFRTYNRTNAPWDYAAIVNLTTGKADDAFTAEELLERLPVLAAAWDGLQENDRWMDYLRWYTTWHPTGDISQWPFSTKEEAEALFLTLN